MSGIKDIRRKCIALGLKARTAQALIEILSGLQGYSKREDLLEKAYYRVVGKSAARNPYSHFGRLCLKLLEFGLLQEKQASGGYRFALNKKVWEQDADTIEILSQYAELMQEEMRSDVQISTIVSKVRKLYQEDSRIELVHSIVEPIVAFVVAQKNPDIQNGNYVRFKHTKRKPEDIYKSSSFLNYNHKITEPSDSKVLAPLAAKLKEDFLSNAEEIWPMAVMSFLKVNNFQTTFHPSQEIIITVNLAQNRNQQVYIRRETDDLLRIETISGPLDEVNESIANIFKRNDNVLPIKVAVMDRGGISFVGCVSILPLASENLPFMKDLIVKTARLGDELENTYWGKDLY